MNESCLYTTMSLTLPAYRTTIAALYLVTAVTSVLFNALVILSIWKTPSLHNPSYMLIANLAVTDFIVGAVAEPLMFIANLAALTKRETVFCYSATVGRGSGYWMGAMSLYTLTAISVDRFLAIQLKRRYRTVVSLKRVIINLIVWWSGTCSLLVLFRLNIDNVTIILSTYLFLLLGTLTACYSMSYYKLKKLSFPVSPITETGNNNDEPQGENSRFHVQKYRRSLNTTLLVFFTVMLFYIPYFCSLVTTTIVYKLVPYASRSSYRNLLYKFITSSELVVYVNSTMNPFLYLWRMRDLSKAARKTLNKVLRWKVNGGGENYAHENVQQI